MTIQSNYIYNSFLVKKKKYFHVCIIHHNMKHNLRFGVAPRKNTFSYGQRSLGSEYDRSMTLNELRNMPKKYKRLVGEPFEVQKLQAHFIKMLKVFYGLEERYVKK